MNFHSTATTAAPSAITLDKVLAAAEKMKEVMGSMQGPELGAISVRQSPFSTRTEPVKTHKRRRAQTEAYHKRIQKKWAKRYGTKQVPCAYVIDNSYLGLLWRTLVAHPSLLNGLRHKNEATGTSHKKEPHESL